MKKYNVVDIHKRFFSATEKNECMLWTEKKYIWGKYDHIKWLKLLVIPEFYVNMYFYRTWEWKKNIVGNLEEGCEIFGYTMGGVLLNIHFKHVWKFSCVKYCHIQHYTITTIHMSKEKTNLEKLHVNHFSLSS